MCGLIGGELVDDLDLAPIRHRGPDGEGIVEVEGWTLGHTRLAIQDLTDASSQPWRTDRGWLTYNGELWHPDELRERYGGTWRTSGDTEVVARYVEDGASLIELDGMFALAWTVDDVLLVARDPYGEVPLHWGLTSDRRFVYGSTIASVLSLGAHPRTVRWVEPGTVLVVRHGEPPKRLRWFVEPEQSTSSVHDLLERATIGRLTSDAPVALLLSGGLDSSAIASLVDRPLVAYTAVHHPAAKDRRCAHVVADRLGIELVEVPIPGPSSGELSELVRQVELPHKAQVEIAWCCRHLADRLAADGIRVVLSGEGSDELLASYAMAYHGIRRHGWEGYRRASFEGQHRKNFARTNKVFMAAGVEARLPFLDPNLVATLLARSQREVTGGGRHPKAILADAVVDRIGSDVAYRPKAAFQTEARIDRAAATAVADPRRFYRSEFRRHFGEVEP